MLYNYNAGCAEAWRAGHEIEGIAVPRVILFKSVILNLYFISRDPIASRERFVRPSLKYFDD